MSKPTPKSKEELTRLIFLALCRYFGKDDEDHEDSDDVANFTDELMQLFTSYHQQQLERAKDTVSRFEVINHLSDGSGRETVVWKDKPFEVEYVLQDDGRTLKVFLADIKQLQSTIKEDKSNE